MRLERKELNRKGRIMERFRKKYRHELKFLVDERDIALLESKIKNVLKPDKHNGEKGYYKIRSIYLDGYGDNCFEENESGVSPREKYRIRSYDCNDELIFLECKMKDHEMTYKKSCRLSKEQFEGIMAGRPGRLKTPEATDGESEDVLRKLQLNMQLHHYHPCVVVEYNRTAYVCHEGNVRITFDKQIAGSSYFKKFFDMEMPKRPVMPAGTHVLEVKYDEFLPNYIREILDCGKLRRTSYSKYYLCRQFHAVEKIAR